MHVLPKLTLGLCLIVANIDNSVVAAKEEAFYVVSPSSDSEKFYLKLSRLGARNEEDHAREDVTCATILKSPFFAAGKKVEVVDPNNVRAYARFHPERKDWFMFTRPYETVNVSIEHGLTQQEAVFPCLAKAKGTNKVTLYLVSHVYDFKRCICMKSQRNKVSNRIRIRGRFVFEYTNTAKNMAQLIAVAEQPGPRLDKPTILFHRDLFEELEDGDMFKEMSDRGRSICKFARGRKIRICSVGLNAEEYRPEITFLPLDDRIESECEKRELFFRNPATGHSFTFNEWVIGCKAELVAEPGTFATYYVSLGSNPYQFLIYHPPNETSNNVSAMKHHFYSYLGADNDLSYRTAGFLKYTSNC